MKGEFFARHERGIVRSGRAPGRLAPRPSPSPSPLPAWMHWPNRRSSSALIYAVVVCLCGTIGAAESDPARDLAEGRFSWLAGPPLVFPASSSDDFYWSIKDPSVVRFGDRWHLFCTVRGKARSHQIEYLAFADWAEARTRAQRQMLRMVEGYFCAPQIFYFTPHRKWYLIYQASDPTRKPQLQPVWSTNNDLAQPAGWSPPRLLFDEQPKSVTRWIDFWVICDETHAYLFFTSLDGRMWRSRTTRDRFPSGWDEPSVCLRGDIFEAGHVYRLKGLDWYLAIVEAQAGPRRYYKAYRADRLDGLWRPLADTERKPFAAPGNVRFTGPRWTDSFSHGELLRTGHDETMEVDPKRLRFLYQGVKLEDAQGKPYGQIPWRLGLLEANNPN